MALRHHTHEHAFELELRRRRITAIAIDEARQALLPTTTPAAAASLKNFDFLISSPPSTHSASLPGQPSNVLVELKGRKASTTPRFARRGRLENWVTREDVRSMLAWEQHFGPGFTAAFVFLYRFDTLPPDGLFEETFAAHHAPFSDSNPSCWYGVRAIRVRDYARAMTERSPRWQTVELPRNHFDRLSGPIFSNPRLCHATAHREACKPI